jgi:uncharacterized membrane protein
MKKKIYNLIMWLGLLIVVVVGGFIYSYFPVKFIEEGYSVFDAKQKTLSMCTAFYVILGILYLIFRLLGLDKWNRIDNKQDENVNHSNEKDDSTL